MQKQMARHKTLALIACLLTGLSAYTLPTNAENTAEIANICAKDGVECHTSAMGIVIGKTGRTAPYHDAVDTAAARFQEYFGTTAPKAAVILGNFLGDEDSTIVRDVFPVVMPWVTAEDRRDFIEDTVRNQVRQQQPDITDIALEAIVKRSVEASLKASGANDGNDNNAGATEETLDGALSHELGHLYFIRTYWPDDALDVSDINPATVRRYGGPAEDWLDEMSAVLLENDILTNGRNQGLKEAVAEDFRPFWPLEEYFTMVHPAFEQAMRLVRARQETAEGRAQGGVVILSAGELDEREDGRTPATFYAQSRGFADYMIEKSGNKQIFAKIASYVASGKTITDWVHEYGTDHNIPANISTLEADFHEWLRNRFSET
jgi:hypothetical protein